MLTVVGATGKTGRRLCATLRGKGEAVLALGRDPCKLAELAALGAETRVLDILDSRALSEAFHGASAVYLMSPTGPRVEAVYEAHRQIGAALALALRVAGVSHAVLMSACGVHREDDSPIRGMQSIEAVLRAVLGLNLALLRPAFFMENFFAWLEEVRDAGSISNVISPGRPIPLIATRDIADVAARLMLDRDFEGAVPVELLGPRDCSMDEATAVLGESIGIPDLSYRRCGSGQVERMLQGFGYAPRRAAYLAGIFAAFDDGRLSPERPRDAASETPTEIETFAAEEFAPAYRALAA